jgi:hypothetical protein
MDEHVSKLKRLWHFLLHTLLHSILGGFLHRPLAWAGGSALSAIIALYVFLRRGPVAHVALGFFCAFALMAVLSGWAQYRKTRQERLLVVSAVSPLVPMTPQVTVDHLRVAWGCSSKAIHVAWDFLDSLCVNREIKTDEQRSLCQRITQFVLRPHIQNVQELDVKLNAAKDFSIEEFDTLKGLFKKAIADYGALLEAIDGESAPFWGEKADFRKLRVTLAQQDAKCREELEKLKSLPDLRDIVF